MIGLENSRVMSNMCVNDTARLHILPELAYKLITYYSRVLMYIESLLLVILLNNRLMK